jgi:hypothetical protein
METLHRRARFLRARLLIARAALCLAAIFLAALSFMVTALAGATATAATAAGQDPSPPRWNLRAGDRLRVRLNQTTHAVTSIARQASRTDMQFDVVLDWQVLEAEEDVYRLRQRFQRLAVRMTSPDRPTLIEYDSASDAPVGSQASETLAESLQPLLEARIELTMNRRGEVLQVEVEGLPEAREAAGRSAALTAWLDPENLQHMLGQLLPVLPEQTPQEGEQWQEERAVATAVGEARQTTTYTWHGRQPDEPQPDEPQPEDRVRIDFEGQLQLSPRSDAQSELRDQRLEGQLLFDRSLGRYVEGELEQALTASGKLHETYVHVRLVSRVRLRLEQLPDGGQ